jgi:4-hydroxy-tetrahydrodipicolinate reductase
MKIALIGYGKMGKAIEDEAMARGHEIVLRAGRAWDVNNLSGADVAIEFSRPESAEENILRCFDMDIPVIVGTTGWYHLYPEIKEKAQLENRSMLTASNFSIGVNLFFKLNEQLAKLMNPHAEYDVIMNEIHHTKKLDAPSGTAITLAEGILDHLDRKKKWVGLMADTKETGSSFDLKIISHRLEDIPGTHIVSYGSEIDEITISHIARSRKGFALGAVIAAEWLKGRKGVFTMNDVLNL